MNNKRHLVIAILVAPVLSYGGWWAVGNLLGAQPQPALPGQSYPLVQKSNCRYASGVCDFENADFKLRVQVRPGQRGYSLQLTASHPLSGVVVAVSGVQDGSTPAGMRAVDESLLRWSMPLSVRPQDDARIQLAASASGSVYFGETGVAFMQPEGSGSQVQ